MMLLQERWPLGLKRCSNLLYTNFSWPTASNIIQVFFVFMAIIHLSSYRSSRGLTPRHLEVTHEGWDTNFRRFVFILNRLAFLNCSSCLNEGLKKKKSKHWLRAYHVPGITLSTLKKIISFLLPTWIENQSSQRVCDWLEVTLAVRDGARTQIQVWLSPEAPLLSSYIML